MKGLAQFVLIASVLSCGITDPHDVTLRFEGTVTAASTGLPVAGAQISLYEPTLIFGADEKTLTKVTTDASGRYSLHQTVGKGCYGALFGLAVGASATGFDYAGRHVDECIGDVQHFDFIMTASPAP